MSLPGKAELERNVTGAFQLLLQKPQGLESLDASPVGFWRSFYAALYGAPFFLFITFVSLGANQRAAEAPEAAQVLLGIEFTLLNVIGLLLIYAISWLYWPLLFHYVAKGFGLQQRFFSYIVAYNWAALIQLGIRAVALLLGGSLLGTAGGILIFASVVLQFFYQWSVARQALEVSGLPAAGLVFLDFVVGQIVLWAGLSMLSAAAA
ncbi:hypothetical protein [Limibacillus halophilus]